MNYFDLHRETPKEKAIQLVSLKQAHSPGMIFWIAKVQSLVELDIEIDGWRKREGLDSKEDFERDMAYWQEVRQEIINL